MEASIDFPFHDHVIMFNDSISISSSSVTPKCSITIAAQKHSLSSLQHGATTAVGGSQLAKCFNGSSSVQPGVLSAGQVVWEL
jgi:hypothetical protein